MSKKQASFKKVTENYRIAVKEFRKLMAEVDTWDEQRVAAEQEQWEQEGGKQPGEQPAVSAAIFHHLELLREQHARGNAIALFQAIEMTLAHELPPTDWVYEELEKSLSKLRKYEVRTLDEAFHYRLPKNAKLPKLRKKEAFGYKVFREVIRRSKAFGEGITDKMFDSIGVELGMSGPSAKELYYELRKELPEERQRIWEAIEYIRRVEELGGTTWDDEPSEDNDKEF